MAPGGGSGDGGSGGAKDDQSVPVLGSPPASLDMPFNPFYSDGAAISTAYEAAKTALLLPVAVLRLLLWALCIAFGFLFVKAALLGARNTLTKPFQPWRRHLLLPVRLVARLLLFACGFQWISVKGRPAPRHVAPILVCNHVTFADPVFAFAMHLPIAVTAQENVEYPVVGAIMRAMQVITVDRGERESRKKAAGEIKRRAMCNDWNRVIVFPEATTTNGKSLVSFKLGAFTPGFAVQPIVFRYPHVHLNPSWCAAGPSVMLLLFRLMTQFHNFMQVEYLPVVEPTPRELHNPTLFAERVRMSMARVLNATVTEHSFEDVALILAAQKLGDSGGEAAIEFGKFERLFRLTPKEAKQLYAKFSSWKNRSMVLFYDNFVQMLGLPDCEPVLRVFSSMDQYDQGFINFRQYTAWAGFISRHHMLHEIVEASFQLFDRDEDGFLSKDDVKLALNSLIPSITSQHVQRFWDQMNSNKKLTGDVTLISKPEFILFFQSNPEYPAVVLFARPNLLSSSGFRELDSTAESKQR